MFPFVARIRVVTDVKPRPAIKASVPHTADIVGRQIFADLVPLVCTHPEFIRSGAKRNADGVANSPRVTFCPLPSGLNSKMRARFSSAALSDTFEREPIDTYIFLPSDEKTMQRVQCPAPRNNPPGERCAASCWAGPRALRSPLR